MKRLSLRIRFALVLLILMLVVFFAITATIVNRDSKTLKASLVNSTKSFAALATQPIGDSFSLYQNSGTVKIQQQVNSFTDLDPNINQVQIVSTLGKTVFIQNPSNPIKVSQKSLTSLNPSYMYNLNGDLTAVVQPYIESYGIHSYAIVYGVSYQSVNQAIQSIVLNIIIVSLIILLISLVLWYLLINKLFLSPVADISKRALKISTGDLSQKIESKRKDEIGDLALAVDTMANSLKDDIAKLQQLDKLKSEFMMITSHNLRTPVSIIKGYIDNMRNMDPPENILAMLEPISVNANRLGEYAEDALTVSSIENGKDILGLTLVDIAPLLRTVSDEFSKLAEQKKLSFDSLIETSSKVNINVPGFRSALWNLLDNAYKFTKEGQSVSLMAVDNNGNLEVSVKDTGVGISSDELPKLFTKFHRATDTLKFDYEGVGIGLYVSKLVIEQQGGTIKAESKLGEGSVFTIFIPISISEPIINQAV